MSTATIIIISVFSFFFVLNLTFMLRRRIKKGSKGSIAKDIVMLILATVFFPAVIYVLVTEAYYHNRPRPLPRKLRKFLKKDLVHADGRTMSIAEYNATHKTQYTLEQVYGKKYVRSLTEEDKAQFDTFDSTAKEPDMESLPEGLATEVAAAFQKGLVSGDFTEFSHYLAEDVKLVIYERRTLDGMDAVSFYWSDYVVRAVRDNVPITTEICTCGYDGSVVVKMCPRGYDQMYVMFRLVDGLVKTMLSTPIQLQPVLIRYYNLNWKKFDRETVNANLGERIDEIFKDRMPCMCCGETSENLEWYKFDICHGPFGHKGRISICPHCKEMVEFYPEVFYRCD